MTPVIIIPQAMACPAPCLFVVTLILPRKDQGLGGVPTPDASSVRGRTEEAKAVYRLRGSTAEWANAQVSHHGVSQFTVRGLAKVTTVMLLVAAAHNLVRWVALAR